LSCSVLLAVVIAELLARRFIDAAGWPPYYVGEFENKASENFVVDEFTGWRMRPQHAFTWTIGDARQANEYAANSRGFRSDKEFSEQGPVVLVGDSFTFGTGVAFENTFGAVLEKRLGDRPVYNFAMPGFGIDQMWQAVRHQVAEFHPTLIVVAFIDEDFDRSLTAFRPVEGFNKPSFVIDGGELRPRTPEDQPPALVTYLRRNLALGSIASQNMQQLGRQLPLGSWWTLNARLLEQIAADAEAMDVPVLFVRLPAPGQREFATLSAFMREINAHYLDLEAGTKDNAESEIFISGDGHINAAGHQLVAAAIADWINTRK
jgi:hypothetical protein